MQGATQRDHTVGLEETLFDDGQMDRRVKSQGEKSPFYYFRFG